MADGSERKRPVRAFPLPLTTHPRTAGEEPAGPARYSGNEVSGSGGEVRWYHEAALRPYVRAAFYIVIHFEGGF